MMMELQYREDDASLCRSLDEVPVSDNVRSIAQELECQIDRPVVYWLNFEGDNNYSYRHPFFQNQFWVSVKSQEQQGELDRLVLAGLYRGVLDRKRLLWAIPKQEYEKQIVAYSDDQHKNAAYKMINKVNSFVSSIDAELFLKQFRIQTSDEALQRLLNSKISGLEEYINMQTDDPNYRWYPESEINNLIDLSNLYRRGGRYQYWVEKMVNRLQPKSVRKEYLNIIKNISDLVKSAPSNYTNDSVRDTHDALLKSILEGVNLKCWLDIRRWDVKEGEIPISQAMTGKVYSYIPVDLPNQDFLVKSIRYAREMIAMIEEYCSFFDKETNYPITSVTLVDSSCSIACVNGNAQAGYYISFMSGIFYVLKDRAQNMEISFLVASEYNLYWPEANIREELYKYAVFFVAAHEYGHILNGDCDPTTQNKPNKERAANLRALSLLKMLVGMQNKYHGRKSYPKGALADIHLLTETMRMIEDCFSDGQI
ncbi:MAG: hypothetical protein LUH07_05030 [Lachnospiraceae bacterium]|nr:hypothetical protein [Lachnospiraceae bacterium]